MTVMKNYSIVPYCRIVLAAITFAVLVSPLPLFAEDAKSKAETPKTLKQLQAEYSRLLPLWQQERQEFGSSSNTYDYWKGARGKAIIELGPAIIPLLIHELRKGDFFFNVPLALITKIDIASGKGLAFSEQEKARLWIEWWGLGGTPVKLSLKATQISGKTRVFRRRDGSNRLMAG